MIKSVEYLLHIGFVRYLFHCESKWVVGSSIRSGIWAFYLSSEYFVDIASCWYFGMRGKNGTLHCCSRNGSLFNLNIIAVIGYWWEH